MTPKSENRSPIGAILLTCTVVIVWGVGKVLFKALLKSSQPASRPSAFGKAPPAMANAQLESLSLESVGNAPLDHLARTAAAEEGDGSRIPPEVNVQSDGAILNAQATINPEDEVLKHQSLESPLLRGWNAPAPERLPVPTFAPAIMAMGIVVFAMGIVTTWYVGLVGVLIFAVAAWRWVGELQGE